MNSLLGSMKYNATWTSSFYNFMHLHTTKEEERIQGNTVCWILNSSCIITLLILFGSTAVLVKQATLDFSCVIAVEAQNSLQEIFNSKPNVQSHVEKGNSSSLITFLTRSL